MGTRADFYVGLDHGAEWLGSIAFDGYPDGVFHEDIAKEDRLYAGHGDERQWREDVAEFLASRDDSTLPEHGWPWPWGTSATTDWAYTYDPARQAVLGSCFGSPWYVVADGPPQDAGGDFDESIDRDGFGAPTFPDMSERRNVRTDKGSGAIFMSFGSDGMRIEGEQ